MSQDPMARSRHTMLGMAALLFTWSPAALAQGSTDVIRGRITDDSAHAVIATVRVTRGPDRLTRSTTSDSAGRYRVIFENGTGDYLVYVSAPGLKAARLRVQRKADEHELVADFTLRPDITLLSAVKVTADKPERATHDVGPMELEPGASERWVDGVRGQVAPSLAGDLTAIAGTFSNVGLTPNGPSILGSGSESNLTTLNGMGLAAGAIPRAANAQTRITGATFDPTRGGFVGANTDVQLEGGSRDYQQRRAFLTLDPRALQFTDASSRSLGAQSGGFRSSLGADGEIIRDAMTYNVALDLARSRSEPVSLLTADADVMRRVGVSPDSIAHLIAVAGPLGIPLNGFGVPDVRQHDAISWIGRLDDTRDTLRTRTFTSYGGITMDGAIGVDPAASPSSAGEHRQETYGGQLVLGDYVGTERRVLTETRVAASAVRDRALPYLSFPSANVLLRSSGSGASTDIADVTLGGGSALVMDDRRWTLEGANETAWNAGGRRHRFKALVWARWDGVRREGIANALGNVSYNSIADIAGGRPSRFSRTLAQPAREGSVWNGAFALAHLYAPSRYFNVIYGARIEADGFRGRPAENGVLEQALGVRSGVAPSRLHVSPRVGFSYTYNRDRSNGNGMMMNNVGTYFSHSSGTLRGGIGEFRDLLRPGLLADASAATGLSDGTLILSCVGAAVPAINWMSLSDPGAIPSRCADGSGVLGERAPAVTLIDPSYDVPHSWRASLDWTTSVGAWLFGLNGLASYDLNLPGAVDANFAGVQRFSLGEEGQRPVYVSPASVDPSSGTVSAAESRRVTQFGSVLTRVSDLTGYGGQLTFRVAPDVMRFKSSMQLFSSLSYTLQESRRQYRGFDGAAFGDPRDVEWAPNTNDARHVVVLTGGLSTGRIGTVTMFARFQSGLPFTPLVQGDVNGDGRSGDRAFISDPAVESDPAVSAHLRSLMESGSTSARECLATNLGRVADRNSCRGGWLQSLNVQWAPPMPSRWARKITPMFYFQNVLAGVDQLVHGSEGLREWGATVAPDPVLLTPRGFDAGAQRFRYDVNPRFADMRPSHSLSASPFRIVFDVSLNLSTDYDLQQLRRATEPVRRPDRKGYERRNADSLTAFYLSRTSDLHKMLLAQSDSLLLGTTQVRDLVRADSIYSSRIRAIYRPLGEFLASGGGVAGSAQLDSARATQKAYWIVFWEQPEIADAILTPVQRDLIPMLKSMLGVPPSRREFAQYGFGSPVKLVDTPERTGGVHD